VYGLYTSYANKNKALEQKKYFTDIGLISIVKESRKFGTLQMKDFLIKSKKKYYIKLLLKLIVIRYFLIDI